MKKSMKKKHEKIACYFNNFYKWLRPFIDFDVTFEGRDWLWAQYFVYILYNILYLFLLLRKG